MPPGLNSKPAPHKRRGRPLAVPPGSPIAKRFKELWNAGTLIETMALELGLSERQIKYARRNLELKTRRPGLGQGKHFDFCTDAQTYKLLSVGATRKGMTKAAYLRALIRRDAGLKA